MKRIITITLLLVFCQLLPAQKEKIPFVVGLQSGVNFTYNNIPENNYVEGDLFLGNSLGIVMRQYLTRYRFAWGGFRNKTNLYVEYGLQYHYRGYNYFIQDNSFFREKIRVSLPLLLVFRSDNKYTPRSWRKKRLYAIMKTGLQLDGNFNATTEVEIQLADLQVVEFFDLGQWNTYFVGEIGLQQYSKKNNSSMYVGLSFHNAFSKMVNGSFDILDLNTRTTERFDFARLGSYLSLNCQYFFDFKKREKVSNQTIHSPRYL